MAGLLVLAFAPISGAHGTEPIKLAIALPLSGPQKALGAEIKAAIDLALADAAALVANGTPPIIVSWHDDLCTADGGAAVAAALVADPLTRPIVVIGHACPSASLAATPIYAAAGLTLITAGSLPARVAMPTRAGAPQFRLPADGTQGALIGAALVTAGPAARIAVVRDRTLLAQTTLQPVIAALSAQGRQPLLLETFAGGEKDFAALAQRLKAANISHIALAAFPSEAVLLLAEVRKVAPDVIILATDQLADPDFGRLAGRTGDGIAVALAPDARAFPDADDLMKRLAAKGITAGRATLTSYAAVQVVISAATAGTSGDSGSIARALIERPAATILGSLSFDATGAVSLPPYVFYNWRDGQLRPPPR